MITTIPSGARRWVLVTCAAAMTACATNPVTGKSELSLVSEEQEIQLGQQSAQEVAQSIGLVQNDALQNYVQRVGADLAKDSERPNLPWTFRVVDDPTPNAFALPGGFIFVTRGMLDYMSSEAELASVLGHEIGHVTAKHSVQQISRTQLAQLGLGLGAVLSPTIARYSDIASTGLQLLFLKYGRDAERQADDLGFKYMLQDNYDPRAMANMFTTLQRIESASKQSPLPTFLSTHPYPEERLQATQQRLAQLSRSLDNLQVNRDPYLRQVDGLVFGENPRNGFFQNGVFYHPDLRFRLSFPQGWQTQNLSQAVVGVSPQQDAIVQLTLAESQSASTAAQQFFSQQGVQPAAQASRTSVNGVPAVASYFQAQTDQGVLQGLAGFLEYGGRTYQLLAYSPAGSFSQYQSLFSQVLSSFAPVTDQRILAVSPNRVQVVRLDQAQTLAQFNQRYPSVVDLSVLATLNGLDSPNTTIPAGTSVKRVVGG
jgi:predicted Zn-dependent protease